MFFQINTGEELKINETQATPDYDRSNRPKLYTLLEHLRLNKLKNLDLKIKIFNSPLDHVPYQQELGTVHRLLNPRFINLEKLSLKLIPNSENSDMGRDKILLNFGRTIDNFYRSLTHLSLDVTPIKKIDNLCEMITEAIQNLDKLQSLCLKIREGNIIVNPQQYATLKKAFQTKSKTLKSFRFVGNDTSNRNPLDPTVFSLLI